MDIHFENPAIVRYRTDISYSWLDLLGKRSVLPFVAVKTTRVFYLNICPVYCFCKLLFHIIKTVIMGY